LPKEESPPVTIVPAGAFDQIPTVGLVYAAGEIEDPNQKMMVQALNLFKNDVKPILRPPSPRYQGPHPKPLPHRPADIPHSHEKTPSLPPVQQVHLSVSLPVRSQRAKSEGEGPIAKPIGAGRPGPRGGVRVLPMPDEKTKFVLARMNFEFFVETVSHKFLKGKEYQVIETKGEWILLNDRGARKAGWVPVSYCSIIS